MSSPVAITRVVPTEDQYAWTFGGYAPIMRIAPGDVLDLFTEDAFGGRIRSTDDLPSRSIQYPYINPQTGPFHVEGAEPGDTLAIHLIDVQPARDWAVSTTVPLFGALTGTKYTATLQGALPERTWFYTVDGAAREVIYRALDSDFTTRLPLEPFLGTIGVAPAAGEARNVLVPEAFGGNMDTPEARAGTTIYLGVNVEGALFSIGDGHYTMGEGEVCGVAVEGAMDTLLTVDVIKGIFCEWPRLEDDDSIMVAGSYRPAGGRVPHRPHPAHPLDLCGDRPLGHGRLPAGDAGVTLADRERLRCQLHDRGQDAQAIPARERRLDGRRPRPVPDDRCGCASNPGSAHRTSVVEPSRPEVADDGDRRRTSRRRARRCCRSACRAGGRARSR